MSLLIWLPLNGDLENKGASNLQFSNSASSGITTNTSGKIGSCYYRASAKSAGRIESNSTILLNEDISMCCWAKVTATVGDTANGLISNHSHADKSGFGLGVKQISSDDYRISCSTGNGSSRTYYTYYGTTNIKNTWHHLALTYNNTTHEFQLWVDGIVEKTQSYTNNPHADKILLFDWSTTNDGNSYKPACYLNDVRIYNHCLSAAEVHEISQGLVLHYKLDDIPQNFSKNANTSWTNFTIGQWYTTLFSYSMSDFLAATGAKNGDKFTWSVDIKSTAGTKALSARVQHYNSGSNRTSVVGNAISAGGEGHSYVTFTVDTSYNQLDFMITNSSSSTVTNNTTEQYKNTKIQAGDVDTGYVLKGTPSVIQDSSGYNNNGTIFNNLSLSSNTPRYFCSTIFEKSKSQCICGGRGALVTDALTASFWLYMADWSTMTRDMRTITTANSCGWYLDPYTADRLHVWVNVGPTTNNSNKRQMVTNVDYTKLSAGWHHMAITYDQQTISYYLDGVLDKSTTWNTKKTIYYTNSTALFLGAKIKNATQPNGGYFDGGMSDVRIYCTPLSADDIKQLYELGAKVDNKGNLHCYELKEYSTLPKIHKNGIVQHKVLHETGLLNNITSFSYKPAANTNNSCTNGAILDFTAFANEGQSVTFSIEYDVSWSGLAAGTGGTFRTLIQGSNRLKSNNSWAWQGSNYFTGFNFTSSVTSNATGSIHKTATVTIPASWFDTYNGSYFGFRTDYANGTGTVSISNLKVTVQSNIFKLKKSSIMTNNLIEF